MRIRHLFAGMTFTLIAFSASALERQFPSNAKVGTASFASYPKIIIDNQERKPAPGLRIWNENNVMRFQRSFRTEGVMIRYTQDYLKLIDRIWILRPEEIRKLPPRPDLVTVN